MKVLVLQHDPEHRETIAGALRRGGHEMHELWNGDDPVAVAASSQPDIVLCAVHAPGRSGFEILEGFQRRPDVAGIPFIFLGSDADQSVVRKAMGQGGDDVLVVPFGEQDLLDAIDARLRRIHLLVEPIRHQLDELRLHLDETKRLSEITHQINAGMLMEDILDRVYATFASIIPYDRIGLALLEEGGTKLRARWARSRSTNIRLNVGYVQRMAGSSLEAIFRTGRPRIINDLEAYYRQTRASESTALVLDEGVRSSLTCPLISNGKTVGFLFFSSFEKDTYRSVHTEVFQQLANQLSIIVEKAKVYEELIALNDMKNRFLGIAAHDLRNPMNVILLVTEALQLDPSIQNSASLRRKAELMHSACAQALALLNGLLDVSAIESGKLALRWAPVTVAQLLETLEAMHRLTCEHKRIGLQVEASEEVRRLTLVCDPQRLQQVFDNLLSNAVKFSGPGTTVAVRVHRDGDRLQVAVADQGPGIPPEEVSKVFREFETASARPTGGETSTGLGLAIVKRLVTAHRGSVRVESQVGRGTAFIVTIPLDASLEP